MTSVGKITVKKKHIIEEQRRKDFDISAFMQQQICFLGQEKVFATAAECFASITGVQINAKQIERVCHHYGELLEHKQQAQIKAGASAPKATDGKRYYIMPDGGMILTREEKWKEMKLARIFSEKESISISKHRRYIGESVYVAHLGGHKDFLQKVEYHLDSKAEIVFVADGAPWIWKWAETMYPESTQILDFYHAKQHLCEWAEIAIVKPEEKERWVDYQTLLLLNDKVGEVIKNISARPAFSTHAKQKKMALMEYYTVHKERMKYRTFRINGLTIGSGAIEAAHKHIIQQRMKLSGQRWTKKGVQQIANLRTTFKSNQWNTLIDLTKMAA